MDEPEKNQTLEQHILKWQVKSTKFHLENREMVKRKPMPKITAKGMGKPCPTCGKIMSRVKGPSQLSLEHIVPRSTGGDNSFDGRYPQCIPMCKLCNHTRNKVVLAIGVDTFETGKRVTPEAIRFLITQVYGEKKDLDSGMLNLFLQRSALDRSKAEREVATSLEKTDTPLVAQSKPKWWNPRSWFEKSSSFNSEISQESASVERIQPNYLNLTKEETLVQFEKDLIEAIANENYSGKSYHSTSLVALCSPYGGTGKLKEKIEMLGQTIDEILIHYFPTQFIVQNAGLNQIIHILAPMDDDDFEFVDDDFDFETVEEDEMQEHDVEEMEVEEQTAPPIPMKVIFVREKICDLLEQILTEEHRISCSHILEAMVQLRDDDGTDWEAFFDGFDIDSDGTINENIERLLSLIGFRFDRYESETEAYLQFSLPHNF